MNRSLFLYTNEKCGLAGKSVSSSYKTLSRSEESVKDLALARPRSGRSSLTDSAAEATHSI